MDLGSQSGKAHQSPEARVTMLGLSIPPGHIMATLLLLLALLCLYIGYCRLWSPLAGIPGPFAASLSRLWIVQRSRAGDMHRTMIRLHEKHGQIVRTGPNEVSVTSPDIIKKIYGMLPSGWVSTTGRED